MILPILPHRGARSAALALLIVSTILSAVQAALPLHQSIGDYTLTERLSGQTVKLQDFSGELLFLVFTSHWCPTCDRADSENSIRNFVAQTLPTYPETTRQGLPIRILFVSAMEEDTAQATAKFAEWGIPAIYQTPDDDLYHDVTRGGFPVYVGVNGLGAAVAGRKPWEILFRSPSFLVFYSPDDNIFLGPPITDLFQSLALWWDTVAIPDSPWKWSAAMGFLYDEAYPWAYTPGTGWFYIAAQNNDDFWCWSPDQGWLYAHRGLAPNVWSAQSGALTPFWPSSPQ